MEGMDMKAYEETIKIAAALVAMMYVLEYDRSDYLVGSVKGMAAGIALAYGKEPEEVAQDFGAALDKSVEF